MPRSEHAEQSVHSLAHEDRFGTGVANSGDVSHGGAAAVPVSCEQPLRSRTRRRHRHPLDFAWPAAPTIMLAAQAPSAPAASADLGNTISAISSPAVLLCVESGLTPEFSGLQGRSSSVTACQGSSQRSRLWQPPRYGDDSRPAEDRRGLERYCLVFKPRATSGREGHAPHCAAPCPIQWVVGEPAGPGVGAQHLPCSVKPGDPRV